MSIMATLDKIEKPVARRSRGIAGWIIPGALVALLPKCPMCLVAYAAVAGIGLSFSAATHLHTTLLLLCAGWILFLAAINTRRLICRNSENVN